MIFAESAHLALQLMTFSLLLSASNGESRKLWPDRWLEADVEFGSLVVEARFTNDCGIDPEFEIIEHPNIDVTRTEILDALQVFLNRDFREDIPKEVMSSVSMEVFGTKTLPDRTIRKFEYEALMEKLEDLGPWPTVRTVRLGSRTIRCVFDGSGVLVLAEKSEDEGSTFDSVLGHLDQEDPFRFRWEVED